MIALYYFVGMIIYTLSAIMSYSVKAQAAKWYFPVGIAMAMLANFIWLYIAKNSIGHQTMIRGLIWDSMIVMCFVAVPISMYGVKLTSTTLLGVSLIVVGIILTKLT